MFFFILKIIPFTFLVDNIIFVIAVLRHYIDHRDHI